MIPLKQYHHTYRPTLRSVGLVARMQRLSRLRDGEKKLGVEGRLCRFYLDQLEGRSPRPL